MTNRLTTNPKCPSCESTIDGYTAYTEGVTHPEVGDISVCSYCYEVCEFVENEDGDLTLVKCTNDEVLIDLHDQLMEIKDQLAKPHRTYN